MDFVLWKNDQLKIEQCYTCALPGYLIVSPIKKVNALHKLDTDTLCGLGIALAKATSVIEKLILPEKIYCAQFGEEDDSIHFHIFPRTKTITEEFLRENPQYKTLIHGPVILDWARSKYKACVDDVWKVSQNTIVSFRAAFSV